LNKTIDWFAASRPYRSFLSHPFIRWLVAGSLPKLDKIQTALHLQGPQGPFKYLRAIASNLRENFSATKKPATVSICAPWDATPNCIQLRNLLVKRQDNSNYYRFRTSQGANSPENDSLSSNACFGHSAGGRSDDRAAQAELVYKSLKAVLPPIKGSLVATHCATRGILPTPK
jgi:hypothetical protein